MGKKWRRKVCHGVLQHSHISRPLGYRVWGLSQSALSAASQRVACSQNLSGSCPSIDLSISQAEVFSVFSLPRLRADLVPPVLDWAHPPVSLLSAMSTRSLADAAPYASSEIRFSFDFYSSLLGASARSHFGLTTVTLALAVRGSNVVQGPTMV